MPLLFKISYVIWILSEVLLNALTRAKRTDKQDADKNSLALIWTIMIACNTAAVYVALNYYHPLSGHPAIAYAGLGLIFIGIILRLMIVKSLGRFFTVDVTIREDHRLKKDGFYKYLRHPSYAASLLSFYGFAISLNNWISLLLVGIPVLLVFIYRMRVEENVLTAHFGEAYLAYKKSAKRIIPFVY